MGIVVRPGSGLHLFELNTLRPRQMDCLFLKTTFRNAFSWVNIYKYKFPLRFQ